MIIGLGDKLRERMGWQKEELSRKKQEKEVIENKEIELKKYNEAMLNFWKQIVDENSKFTRSIKT